MFNIEPLLFVSFSQILIAGEQDRLGVIMFEKPVRYCQPGVAYTVLVGSF